MLPSMVFNSTKKVMKTNQIFNFNRFGRYFKSMVTLTYKQTLLLWGTIISSIFLICLIAMAPSENQWNDQDWIPIFVSIYFIAGILYSGSSFSQFRSKEKTVMALMVPITTFERFLYEFLEKIVLFVIVYPIVFYSVSSFAVSVRNIFGSSAMVTNNGIPALPFRNVSFSELFVQSGGFFWAFFFLSIFLFIISFAGAATFRKYPLIKTIVFSGSVLAVIAGYFALIIGKLHLEHPWIESIGDHWSERQAVAFIVVITTIASLVTMAFAYFKLKEKEAK